MAKQLQQARGFSLQGSGPQHRGAFADTGGPGLELTRNRRLLAGTGGGGGGHTNSADPQTARTKASAGQNSVAPN